MKATKETTTTDPAERLEPDTAPTWTVLTFSNNKRRPLTFLSPPPPPFSGRHAADHGDEREHRTIDGPSGVRSGFHPVSADELLNNEPEPVVWVWHRFIASGRLTLLSAYAKVGKSTFAYQLAIAVAQGRPFLDLPTTQGPVLILAVEEHAQDVQRRLHLFGVQAGDPIHIHTGPLGPDDLPVVEAFVRKHRI